ncbi:MAG TPA: Rpn family recombination-promoting nuclease/putative transposase, partial [Thermotogota bacterium]|nr:Rpn family recombination-promoting nuclease/putative transposase [Thermotogota bacterium]
GKEVGEVGQAINLLEELSRSREERAIAEEREKAIRDELSFRKAELEKGLQKGLEKGLQKGLKIGREEEKYEIAKKLIHKGMDLSEVLEITGLSLKDLKNIGNLT